MTLPPLAPGRIPAFHTLGDDVFEDLCRELIQEEAAGQRKSNEGCDDDLEAVRSVADTLQPFANDDRERIIRWAREKPGMTTALRLPWGASRGRH